MCGGAGCDAPAGARFRFSVNQVEISDGLRLRDHCRFMLGHDSRHPAYRDAEAFDQFRNRFTDSRRFPWTTIVSDEPLDWLAETLRFPGGFV